MIHPVKLCLDILKPCLVFHTLLSGIFLNLFRLINAAYNRSPGCFDNGRCPTEKEFIFYGNLEHSSGAVKHMGDNLTGEGEGDDEQIPKSDEAAAFPFSPRRKAAASKSNAPPVSNWFTSQPRPTTTLDKPGFPFVRLTFCPFCKFTGI